MSKSSNNLRIRCLKDYLTANDLPKKNIKKEVVLVRDPNANLERFKKEWKEMNGQTGRIILNDEL